MASVKSNHVFNFLKDFKFPSLNISHLCRYVILIVLALLSTCLLSIWSHARLAIRPIIALVVWILDNVFRTESYAYTGRSVLITGCDTGFGNLLARYLARNGVTVFAGCLDKSGKGAQALLNENLHKLHILQMDVTDEQQVQDCLKYIKKVTGLWGLVNNAGLNFRGDIELTTMSQFQRVNDINAMGVVRITKAFLPLVRKQKGRVSVPLNAAYTMSKYAVEAFSDILRLECHKFGVSVSIIEPGNFGGATGCLNIERLRGDFEEMWQEMSAEVRVIYGRDYIDRHVTKCESSIPTACFDLMRVIRGMEHALFSERPNTRYLISGSSGFWDVCTLRVRLNQYLPTWLMDKWLLRDINLFKLSHH